MFAKYYASELAFLRERGPELAAGPLRPLMRQLLSRGGDPDVERLVESFAFLTARLRERIDHGAPEVIDALAEMVAPHLQRTIPATSIVEFSPNIQALRGPQVIPRGRTVEAYSPSGALCRFQSCYEVELLPIEIVDVVASAAGAGAQTLTIRLRVTAIGRALLAQPRALRFFIAAEPALASTLRFLVLSRCRGVEVRVLGSDGLVVARSERSAATICAVGLDEPLIPWPELAPQGLRLLHELIAAPDKAMFFELAGPLIGDARGELVELCLHLDGELALPGEVSSTTLRLHCSPVVNLFEATAEPILADGLRAEHLLRVSGERPDHAEIYAITAVKGSRGGRPADRVYRPFYGDGQADPGPSDYYSLRRARSPIDGGVDTYLTLGPSVAEGEVIHVDALAHNRLHAADLGQGAIAREPRSGALRLRNITPVTPPVPTPLDGALSWRLLAHLSLGHAGLADAGNLRRLLSVHDYQAGTPRSIAVKIAGIRGVTTAHVTRVVDGAPLRGLQTTVRVDESAFLGIGEAQLFLTAIARIFADRLGFNTFHELVARLVPSEIELRWPALTGMLAPL